MPQAMRADHFGGIYAVEIDGRLRGAAPALFGSAVGDHIAPGNLVVSLAAGIPTAWLEQRLPTGSSVVRVMPNTPALVDEGMAAR